MKSIFLLLLATTLTFGADATFKAPELTTRYSDKLMERKNSGDDLLKEFDGDAEFNALRSNNKELWVITNLKEPVEIATKLTLDIVYIDGINEEAMCKVIPQDSLDARLQWTVELGLDFISGGVNVLPEHIKICFEKIKNEVGYAYYNQQKEVVKVLPEELAKELDLYRVSGQIDEEARLRILEVQKEFLKTAQCPSNIESYLVLMDIYDQVGTMQLDLFQAENDLSFEKNGNKSVTACAFNRGWNEQYSESFKIECMQSQNSCVITQSEDGVRNWVMNFETNRLEFIGDRILFFAYGEQSIHDGGEVMDLKLIPLTQNLYIEAYLDRTGQPISLGLLTIEK